jgi:hypothetical protein
VFPKENKRRGKPMERRIDIFDFEWRSDEMTRTNDEWMRDSVEIAK